MHNEMARQGGVLLLIWALSLGTLRAGWEYVAVTKGQGAPEADTVNMTVKGWVDGHQARVEFRESANPMLPPGTYMISKDGGKTTYLVNPQKRAYTKWDMDAMMGIAGGVMQMMGINFSQPKIEKLADEKSISILGFPTRYYRFRTSYSMTLNFMGFKKSTETVQEDEIWATDQLQDKGFETWLNQKPAKTGNAELDKLIAAEVSKVQGFPLKRSLTTTQRESDGQTTTTKTSFEVTSLKQVNVPPDIFELPQGYVEQPMLGISVPEQGDDAGDDEAPERGAPNGHPFLKLMQQHMQRQRR